MAKEPTWSGKAFVSYDGIDEKGFRAEVRVVKGFGDIVRMKPSKQGKAVQVIFEVSNTEYDPSAWCQVDSNVYEAAKKAYEAREPIHFRIETRRKDGIDRSIPIGKLTKTTDIARESIHKSLAAVRFEDGDWIISDVAKTRIDEDPATGSPSAYDIPADQLHKPSTPTQVSSGGRTPGVSCGGLEGRPFDDLNPDGSLNPGGPSVAVPLNIYSFLNEYLRERDAESYRLIDERTKVIAVKAILKVCNRAQMEIYEGKLTKPDLKASSHVRARALAFEAIRTFYPLSNEVMTDQAALVEWIESMTTKVVNLWKWSMKEVASLVDTVE